MSEVRWIPDQTIPPHASFWTRANAGEVIPEPPSPAGWDLIWDDGGCISGWRDCATTRLGFDDHELDERHPELAGVIGGYFYLCGTFSRVWAERTPGMSAAMVDAAYYGDHPDVRPYVHEPWHDNPRTGEVMTGWLGWVMGAMDQTELAADRERAYEYRRNRPPLNELSDHDLLERTREVKALCRPLFNQHINQTAAASIGPGALGAICAAVGRPGDTLSLFAGLGGVDSAAPSYAMWELSRAVRAVRALTALFDGGHADLDAELRTSSDDDVIAFVKNLDLFIEEFGSRGPNEWDVLSDVWATNPNLFLALVDRMRMLPDSASPALQTAEREHARDSLSAEIASMLVGDAEASGTFAAALASARTFVAGRERSKTNIIRVLHEARIALRELGRRAVGRGHANNVTDVCMLFEDELVAYATNPSAVHDVVAARWAHYHWLQTLEPPFIINQTVAPLDNWPRKADHTAPLAAVAEVLTGMPGCPGVITGRACVVLDPSDPTALEPGDILIAPVTDPAWTPLFVPAAGVVVNVGAALSHAIIVSRELGIPCVVSVTGATQRIPHGATIEVNGTAGTVTIIDMP
jgi:rifampicin phosphotransferase